MVARYPEREGAFEGQWEGPQIVLTHRPLTASPPDFTITHTLEEAVDAAQKAAGAQGMVHVLGADIARQCLEVGVLDEVLLSTVPIFLGGGTPVLRGTSGSFPLELIDQSPSGSLTRHYRVKK